MGFPNPWNSPSYYQNVKIGGRLIKASLVAIDGVEIEDDWKEQRSTGNSGATYNYQGTKPPAFVTLTFEAVSEEEFEDLRDTWHVLEPKPGSGASGGGATAGSPGSSAYGKQFMRTSSSGSARSDASPSPEQLLAQATQALAALQNGTATTPAASTPAPANAKPATPAPSPGPKPPTLSIENGYVNYIGITAISRKKWKGPYATPTNSFRVDLTVVSQKESTKAAVGAASPKAKDNPGQKTIAFGDIQGPADNARAANAYAAARSART